MDIDTIKRISEIRNRRNDTTNNGQWMVTPLNCVTDGDFRPLIKDSAFIHRGDAIFVGCARDDIAFLLGYIEEMASYFHNKPCPFCGGTSIETGYIQIKCTNCGAVVSFDNKTASEMIEAWNSRVGGAEE